MNLYVNQAHGYAKLVLIDGKVVAHKPNWMPQAFANWLGNLTSWTCYTVDRASAVRFNKEVDLKKTIIDHIVFKQYEKK